MQQTNKPMKSNDGRPMTRPYNESDGPIYRAEVAKWVTPKWLYDALSEDKEK